MNVTRLEYAEDDAQALADVLNGAGYTTEVLLGQCSLSEAMRPRERVSSFLASRRRFSPGALDPSPWPKPFFWRRSPTAPLHMPAEGASSPLDAVRSGRVRDAIS